MRHPARTAALLLPALAGALLLAACGQKGPLYLPEKHGAVVTTPAAPAGSQMPPPGAPTGTAAPQGTAAPAGPAAPAEAAPATPAPQSAPGQPATPPATPAPQKKQNGDDDDSQK
jgi:predicted small lipoprotein YifL